MEKIHLIENLIQQNLNFVSINRRAERELQLSLVQFYLLNHLIQSPGISAQNLAKKTGVHPSTFTQTVKRLKRKELIFEIEHPRDSRKKIYGITVKGKNSIETFQNKIGELLVEN